jgi:hypothetical protein
VAIINESVDRNVEGKKGMKESGEGLVGLW